VYLVGAGPGDPELLTVKAMRLLKQADAVVYDRLVSEEILELIPESVSRIFAGKASRKHVMPQQRINELLVDLARGGQKVVRLKGGDPFVFGRGSEEALYLAQHGVMVEIVPGITASVGCAAYAGIPLTHRGVAKGVRFITGHARNGEPLELDWRSLADPETTLVIYMGLANLDRICGKLVAAGLSAYTPAAAIENGTTAAQRTVLTTIADLPERVDQMGLRAPTLLVVGEVVDMAEVLNWHAPTTGDNIAAHG
jgi:uroporphyrin-III C-methyltransferase/precorrin-2 dehydrogenase/sirohydrochlorin ferrochelatase/uroporphyrin-III C-methyltransferase